MRRAFLLFKDVLIIAKFDHIKSYVGKSLSRAGMRPVLWPILKGKTFNRKYAAVAERRKKQKTNDADGWLYSPPGSRRTIVTL